jgi:plastocyanin
MSFASPLIALLLILWLASTESIAGDLPVGRPEGPVAGMGIIEGTIFYRNDAKHAWRLSRYYVKNSRQGELAEAIAALDSPALKRSAPKLRPNVMTIDQKEMRFVPETAAIRTGDRVRFTNTDPQTHNIFTSDPRFKFNDTLAHGQEAVETFSRASGVRRPFALSCSLHSQMQGWIYVFDHAFYRVTGADGRFRLDNVPAGEYRLDVAHSAGELHASRLIQIKPNETLKVDFVLTPQERSPQN